VKTFYIFKRHGSDLKQCEEFEGTVVDARKLIDGRAYEDGTYLILEDTSGDIVKATETVQKSKVTFTPPAGRKRARKPPEG
jgi:hypothetical protein